jgi:hypothetical protein
MEDKDKPPRRQGRQEKKRGEKREENRITDNASIFSLFLSWRSWRLGGSQL